MSCLGLDGHGRTLIMHIQAGSLVSLTDPSLTEVILALCASGHFGVREAIAAATRQGPRRLGSDPSDAAASSMFQPMPDTSGIPSFRASTARPGIQCLPSWIPAFAGMTKTTCPSFRASTARPGIQEHSVSTSTQGLLISQQCRLGFPRRT
jgi:hypothetical protein